MVRPANAEATRFSARAVAGQRDVRGAVRGLALHVLGARPLTPAHIAIVARVVGDGIESAYFPWSQEVGETTRCGAWAGLEDALGQALQALGLAARQFDEGGGGLSLPERRRVLSEISRMEATLGERWGTPQAIPASLRKQIVSLDALLARDACGKPQEDAPPEGAAAQGVSLALAASGVLLRLRQTPFQESRGETATERGRRRR